MLDTHVVLWLALEPKRLSARAERMMEDARRSASGLAIASCTIWEIALLSAKGKLQLDPPIDTFLERVETLYGIMPLTRQIAARGSRFGSNYPRDPADRQIGATAIMHGLTLITADQRIADSGEVTCLW